MILDPERPTICRTGYILATEYQIDIYRIYIRIKAVAV